MRRPVISTQPTSHSFDKEEKIKPQVVQCSTGTGVECKESDVDDKSLITGRAFSASDHEGDMQEKKDESYSDENLSACSMRGEPEVDKSLITQCAFSASNHEGDMQEKESYSDQNRSACSMCGLSTKKRCTGCEAVFYCTEECQKEHWGDHKPLCNAIKVLSVRQDRMTEDRCVFGHLDPKEERNLIGLVGRRCTVQCNIGGVESEALWDTGAEVSLVSEQCYQVMH